MNKIDLKNSKDSEYFTALVIYCWKNRVVCRGDFLRPTALLGHKMQQCLCKRLGTFSPTFFQPKLYCPLKDLFIHAL